MPFIPAIVNKESAQVGAPGSHATGPDFGSAIGEATQRLGAAFESLGSAFAGKGKEDQARADALTVATGLAKNDFTPEQNQIEIGWSDPSGAGLVETVRDRNLKFANDEYDTNIKGGMSKKNAETIKLARLRDVPSNVNQAAGQAVKMANEHGIITSKDALMSIKNNIALHGAVGQTEFQKELDKAAEVIDNQPGGTKNQKDEGKINFASEAAGLRFDAMLKSARSQADVLAVKSELDQPYWKNMLTTPELERQVLQLDQSARVWGEIGTDPHVNAIRASGGDYDAYLKESKAGLDELNKVANADPGIHAADVQKYKSKTARAYFEAQAEKLAYDPSDKNRAGLVALQEKMKDPKWSGEMTREDYEAQNNSFETHLGAIDTYLNRVHDKADKEYDKQVALRQSEYKVNLKHALAISDKVILPDDAWNELINQRSQLLTPSANSPNGELTAEENDDFNTIIDNQKWLAKYKGLPQRGYDQAKREALNGETRFRRVYGDSESVGYGASGRLAYTARNGVRVEAGIIDQTSVKGMQPRAYQILDGMVEAAPRAGIVRLVITAAKGGGHKSHSEGTEWDVVGLTADGKRWSAEGRAIVAEGARDSPGRADRFGLYEGGNGSLHVGYSGPGRPPAYWGAGGLTGGEASRDYREPASQRFLAGGRGGGVGGGPTGNMAQWGNAVAKVESGGEPAPYTAQGAVTSSGDRAYGKYQVMGTNVGNWTAQYAGKRMTPAEFLASPDAQEKVFAGEFGRLVKKYGNPQDAASAWFTGRPQSAGRTASDIHGTTGADYVAKFNAALGTGGSAGGAGGPARDISRAGSPAGADASAPQGVPARAPMDQPVATGGVVAAAAGVREAALIDKMAADQQASISKDLIAHYETQTGQPQPPLQSNGEGWAQREKFYNQAVDYNDVSGKDRQPFKEAELAAYKNLMGSTNTDGKMQLYGNIAKWQPQMQHDAFKQLATVDPFNAAVGRMVADGRMGLARAAMAGEGLVKSATQSGAKPVWQEAANDAFLPVIGDALVGMDPEVASNKKEVYEAIYADKFGVNKEFDPAAYEKIVEDVEAGVFDTTNGQRVLTPIGTRAGDMGLALPSPILNWKGLSITGTEPLSGGANGQLQPVQDWAKETAKPVRVGDGVYMFIGEDGVPFQTILPDGTQQRFAMTLTADTIKKAADHELSIRTDTPTRGFDNPPAKYGVPGLPGGMGGLMEAPPIAPTPEPQTGYQPPRAVPREVETQLKKSLEVYRQSMIQSGRSEEYANQAGQDYINELRDRWLQRQGYKGQ